MVRLEEDAEERGRRSRNNRVTERSGSWEE
jgi:hypothetical protein